MKGQERVSISACFDAIKLHKFGDFLIHLFLDGEGFCFFLRRPANGGIIEVS